MATTPRTDDHAWVDYESSVCSIARSLDVFGDRWTALIVRDLLNGVRRFDAIQGHLGVSRDILSRRLAGLVGAGVVTRQEYREDGARPRHEYRLTAAGRDLSIVLTAIKDWGDRHLVGEEGPPMDVRHEGCGETVHARLVCEAGHDVTDERRSLELVPLAAAVLREAS